ncbi:hypothetical protein BS78_04G094500 [Paspalum vaginatum]|nr:hypothetical protein BS78_04G094500 [Paspalum vaginatum]
MASGMRVTNIYAPSDHRDSAFFLGTLSEIQSHIVGPSLLVGDFNLLCKLFNDTINDLSLLELPLLDSLFTWSNKRSCPTLARLDRAFVNNALSTAYPSTSLTSLVRQTSDHKSILVTISTNIPKSNLFRFENAWLRNPNFLCDVLPAWNVDPAPSDAAGHLVAYLKSTRVAAKVWSRRNRAPPALIQNCKFLIMLFDFLEEHSRLSATEMQVRDLCQGSLGNTLRERAAYWKQRSKQCVIREGDENTAYHHAHATQRRRLKLIHAVEVEEATLTGHDANTAPLTGYFSKLLKHTTTPIWSFDVDGLYQGRARATDDLTTQFTDWSAPSLDGFGPTEVMQLFQDFHGMEVDLERINKAFMVLLPKKPGRIVNCSIKLITKVLTTRLLGVIPKLVDLDQTGFIKGRRKVPTLVVKLDFTKAFDTVNWDALNTILAMLQLLQTSQNAVLGDPLAPYLFLLVADVLQILIKQSGAVRHPILEDQPCPVLQYTDDTLILLRASVQDVQNLKRLLDSFSNATGLKINYTKSTAVPMNIGGQTLDSMIQILRCKQEGFPRTYLGLPLWQAMLLNPMGRAVLVNSVLDSQLIYIMCVVPLPPGIVSQLDRHRRAFLWTQNVCQSKEDGGLGIKDLGLLNTCLLVKLIHRLHLASDSSWATWVRAHVNLATMEGRVFGTHWDTLRALLPIYQAITSSEIGDGRNTDFWHDAWNGQDDLASRVSVREVSEEGLFLVPRLTPQAATELTATQDIIAATTLKENLDKRLCSLADGNGKMHTSTL